LGEENSSFFSNERPGPLQRGDNHENVKMRWNYLEIFFSRTIRPILTRLGQVLFKGEVITKNVKMGWGHLKIFSRITEPILTRLGTNHPWREGIQVCSKEGDCPSSRGDNSKRVKIHWKIFQNQQAKSIRLGTNYLWMKGIQVCSNKGPGPCFTKQLMITTKISIDYKFFQN
jgi:hypothetical protein